MQYRYQSEPGCGGCLLFVGLLILLTGGAPALLNFLGFLFFAGLMGLVLLFAAFWGFSFYIQRRVAAYAASQTEAHNRFVYLLVHILVHIAERDGHFSRAEQATITQFFQVNLRYNPDQMRWVKQLIKEARQSSPGMESLLEEFRSQFDYEPRLILLELVYRMLYTQPPVSEADLQEARNIAVFLQISANDQRSIEAKYRHQQYREAATAAQSESQAYAVLGLEPGADFEAVKKAYRKLSMQYHPDKVAHLGEEFKAVAEEKMKEINAAYSHFKKRYGKA